MIKKESLFNLERDDEFFLLREEIARTIHEESDLFSTPFYRLDETQKRELRLQAEKVLEIQKKFTIREWKVSRSKKITFKDFLYLIKTLGWKKCGLLINFAIHLVLFNDLRIPEMDYARKKEYAYEVEDYPNTIELTEMKTEKGISIIHTRK